MTTATPFKIHLTPTATGLLNLKQTPEAAETVSSLLQQDLESHHVFFNKSHFHNHIPHHLLTLFSTGASPPSLLAANTNNASYQRPALPLHPSPLADLQSSFAENAQTYFGDERYYPDFLRFFQGQIVEFGEEKVLREFLFAGTPQADKLLVRLFAGFLHPLIQLLYGVEFGQPAIVAEALAQAAVHADNGLSDFLLGAEAAAAAAAGSGEGEGEAMWKLYDAVRDDEKLRGAARYADGDKVREGVLGRAKAEMVAVAGRVKVAEEEVEVRTAEMFDGAVGVAAAAALTPVKGGRGKFDFFLIHHVNAAPIFLSLNKMEWIPRATKARLLEWKMRMDLLQYAARGCPELDMERVGGYRPRCVEVGRGVKSIDIVSRLHDFPDDGHAIKLGRAALICQEACRAYEGTPVGDRFMIKGEDMWQRVLGLIVDSVEAPGPNWVRSAGFEEAWEDVPDA